MAVLRLPTRRIAPEPRSQVQPMSDQERRLHGMLDAMFDESDAAYRKEVGEWDGNERYILGEQWARPRSGGLAQITNNQIWRIVQQSAALLTDTKPYIEITSRPNDAFWARVNTQLREIIEAQWFQNDVDRALVRCVYDLFITSNAYLKCYWDGTKNWGQGDIGISRISPRFIRKDPNATAFKDSEYICYRVPATLWDIRRRFDPERAAMVRPDADLSSYTEGQQRHWFPFSRPRRKSRMMASAVPRAWVEEWLIRDPATDKLDRPLYPEGRMITRALSPRVVLYDDKAPYWDPWPGPWIDFTVNQIEESPYGSPDITQLKNLNDAINVIVSLLIDNARFMTNGIWILDEGALIPTERDKLTSRPGVIVEKRVGREVKRDTGAALPSGVMELLTMLKQDMQFVSGLMDTGFGRAPKGVTAAAAIESLQLATQATIRLKARELEAGLVNLGQRVVARVFQHYTDERVVDLLGPQGIVPMTWDPRVLATLQHGMALGPDGAFPDLDGLQPPGEAERKELLKQFRIRVSPSSSLALSKERKWAMEMALYSAGLTDAKAVLDAIDYPNKEEVLQRIAAAHAQGAGAVTRAAAGPRPRGRGVNVTQNIVGR